MSTDLYPHIVVGLTKTALKTFIKTFEHTGIMEIAALIRDYKVGD